MNSVFHRFYFYKSRMNFHMGRTQRVLVGMLQRLENQPPDFTSGLHFRVWEALPSVLGEAEPPTCGKSIRILLLQVPPCDKAEMPASPWRIFVGEKKPSL